MRLLAGSIISLALTLCAVPASAQEIHNGFVWIEGPDEVLQPNSTYTLEVWGRWDSPAFIQDESAMAGFRFNIFNTVGRDQVDYMSNVQVSGWAAGFGASAGEILIVDVLGVRGGQLANLFGILNPDINLNNPIPLFTFDITTANVPVTDIEFTPSVSDPDGGLLFYPDILDGATISAPDDPDTTLTITPWAYQIPNPMSTTPLFLLAMARRRHR